MTDRPRDLPASPGRPLPFGATPTARGVRFSAFSRHATAVTLLLFDRAGDERPSVEIPLDPRLNRTGDAWHVEVDGIGPGALYLFRVDGPHEPARGHRFDPATMLLDPYVKAVTGPAGRRKGVVISDEFDWQGDQPPGRPPQRTVIYETHVRSLTRHPSAGVEHPGTFRGVAEKIPYLTDLGVTAVELMPVMEFDERENHRTNPRTGERLGNYWGYNTIAFFAPKEGYAAGGAPGAAVTEFKEMARSLHRAGIEVILDIVFNHTAEGDETGPTLNFRGWDNTIYYLLQTDQSRYANFTGCGNTLNCNHPIVRTLIIDCLRYWTVEMHVDGFRFDLGSVLGRDREGRLMENPPILERIAEDPVLRGTKIIAEAWDAAGAYQVGQFPGGRWAEWNDRFRDDTRRFWRGDPGCTGAVATRLTGSADLYLRDGRKPFHSINFVTSHDGFTLNDLVSYTRRHNEENGEGGRDGFEPNWSDNNGAEGPSDDPLVEAVRERQVKNLLATLLLSLGTPMLLGGDEMRRTQRGNNNPWCQDNETSWYDWRLLARHAGARRFCRELIRFRLDHPAFLRPEFYTGGDPDDDRIPDVAWFGADGAPHDWSAASRRLAMLIDGSPGTGTDRDDNDFYLMLNADRDDAVFTVAPVPPGRSAWRRAVDTARPSPDDFAEPGDEPSLAESTCRVSGRSLVVLLSR
ncbi:MAG: glycogen debranching protein GlgX [Spirochaetes bacterium]|nr:glycogen debranching protein GlgX [Spirochaetota bacterium]